MFKMFKVKYIDKKDDKVYNKKVVCKYIEEVVKMFNPRKYDICVIEEIG